MATESFYIKVMPIEDSIVVMRQSRMKFQVAIFCLLAFAEFGVCKSSKSSTEKLVPKQAVVYRQRWLMEMESLERGLKIKNNKGELVQLRLTNRTLRAQAIVRLDTNVRFRVYTKWNPTVPVEFTADEKEISPQLRSSYFDAAKLTVFVTHGWMNDGNSEACTLIRDAYLQNHNVNVVVVDWSELRVPNYEYAARQALFIGDKIAEMIYLLNVHAHMYLNSVILVGHGMGAHIMGIAAYQTNGAVNTIFGLDPAKPLFAEAGIGYRLTTSNAEYVQVIHTNAGHLGYEEPIGHADFYVNTGDLQKGCNEDFACSHSRAYEYFAESITSSDNFYGSEFDSYKNLKEILTSPLGYMFADKIVARMGGHPADQTLRGLYYVQTKGQSPYGLGQHG